MGETSKNKDFESVSLSVNNKIYTKIMRSDEALAYRERQKLIGEVVPEVKNRFDGLIAKLGQAFVNLDIPKTLAARLIGNEKKMYEDFVRPGLEARIGIICRSYINEHGTYVEKAENEVFELKDRLDLVIEETKKSIGDGKIGFHSTVLLSYETLKESMAEILKIKDG
jgi:hypothetical protein